MLEEARYSPGMNYVDLKTMQSCYKQLALAGNLAKEENYQIPVEINGETTAIHLRVLHDKTEGGKVKATFETENHGKVAAEFSIRGGKVTGYIACSTAEGTEIVRDRSESLQKNLQRLFSGKKDGPEPGHIGVVHSSDLDLNAFEAEGLQEESASVQTADLYQIAKTFITVITE